MRGRKVGSISLPPFISAAQPTAVCSGVVETPWPKEMVIELTFFQTFGSVGVATSGSSVCIRVQQAEALQELAVPLDADHVGLLRRADVGRIEEHFRHRQHAALAVEVVDGLAADADRTRRVEACCSASTLPESSAIAVVKLLKVEPIS